MRTEDNRQKTRLNQPVLFIHVPRTGGHTIWLHLTKQGRHQKDRDVSRIKRRFRPNIHITTFMHQLPKDLISRELISHNWLQSRYVFGLVRNPWSRLLSHWRWLRKLMTQAKRSGSKYTPVADTFSQFVNSLHKPETWPKNAQLGFVLTPQREYFFVDDKCIADYIGRYEQFQSSWDTVCRDLGVRTSALRKYQGQTTPANADPHHYRSQYTAVERAFVAGHFLADIETFGYEF